MQPVSSKESVLCLRSTTAASDTRSTKPVGGNNFVRRNRRRLLFITALLLDAGAGSNTPASATIIFESASISTNNQSLIYDASGSPLHLPSTELLKRAVDTEIFSATTLSAFPLSVLAHTAAVATGSNGATGTATADARGVASFVDSSHGVINFHANTMATDSGDGITVFADGGNHFFEYNFLSTADSNINIEYILDSTTQFTTPRLEIFDLTTSGYEFIDGFLAHGNLSDTLTANHDYRIIILDDRQGNEGVLENSAGSSTGFIDDSYSISISDSVPEPSSWMMVVSGFGIIAGTIRRNRTRDGCFSAHG